ncbi:hypothetical protein Ahy_A03g010362 isoform B [Arachis hypogaea]|uniref:Uncharacterized protein n=1 Tax=Arachis hypogaea TaxID=3818 RepID=A0A445DLW2_ARAHY|nr:hypothetical protein Ahy_A03g010362 isoform B [Arachis hypogaea]
MTGYGITIDLTSNYNAVTYVVIFSAAVGVVLRGQDNILTGVHCYNKASSFGGVGTLMNGLFLGDANVLLIKL